MRARLLSLLLPFALACSDSPSTAPQAADAAAGGVSEAGADRLVLMTQNMYVGTDVDALIVALATPDPSDDLPALLTALEILGRTDFPSRSAAIVEAIARHRPHAVGLQELSVIHVDLSAFGLPVVDLDFLAVLQSQLADRGLDYVVAGSNLNFTAAPAPGISLTDFDVMLVDADRVDVTAAAGHTFAVNLGPVAPGVELERGYVVVDATIDGREYRLVSTHPEPDFGVSLAGLRQVQALELASVLAGRPRAVLMGDLNDVAGSPLYQVLAGAGMIDVWPALRPGADGSTDRHPYDLSDAVPRFTRRLDYIMVRGISTPSGKLQGRITLLGDTPSERVRGSAGPIWQSDHAGVIASLLIPSGKNR
jgi:hypothetical protein